MIPESDQKSPSSLGTSLGDFIRLPLELRRLIWGYVTHRIALGNDLLWPDPRSTHGGAVRDRRNALAILRASKGIFAEAMPVVYAGKRFLITIDVDVPNGLANDFEHYLELDGAGPETMPGPSGPDVSTTSWWHLLSRIDISIHPPPPPGRSDRDNTNSDRLWGVLALRNKVVWLVNSFRTARASGLPAIDIEVCEFLTDRKTWLNLQRSHSLDAHYDQWHGRAVPYKTFKDCPWNDLEFVLTDLKRIRNCRDASVTCPLTCSSNPTRFCFDFPKSINQTLVMTSDDHPDSYDAVLTSEMERYYQQELAFWGNKVTGDGMWHDDLGTYRAVT